MKRVCSESDLDALRQHKLTSYMGLAPLVERILDYTETPSYEALKQQRDLLAKHIQYVQVDPYDGEDIEFNDLKARKGMYYCVYCYQAYRNDEYACIHCSVCHEKMSLWQRVKDRGMRGVFMYDSLLSINPKMWCQTAYNRYLCHAGAITGVGATGNKCKHLAVCDKCVKIKRVCVASCFICYYDPNEEVDVSLAHEIRLCPTCYDEYDDNEWEDYCVPNCTICERK